MKFYSKVTSKPNAIIEQVRDGTKIVSSTKLCVFYDGVLDTQDEKVIAKLKKRPDMFRTDRPWTKKHDWRTTPKGIKLLEEGVKLGIDCRHIREFYLQELIANKKGTMQGKAPEVTEAPVAPPKIDYKEIMRLAKEKGFKTHKIKQDVLKKQLKESGINV